MAASSCGIAMSNSWQLELFRTDRRRWGNLCPNLIRLSGGFPWWGSQFLSTFRISAGQSTSELNFLINHHIHARIAFGACCRCRPPIRTLRLLDDICITSTTVLTSNAPRIIRFYEHTIMAAIQEIVDETAFQSTISALPQSTLAVIYFHAPWAKPCEQMSIILKTLASTYPANAPISFLALNAEDVSEISEQYDVTAVPYIVLQRSGQILETVSGSDAAKVRAAVEKYAGAGSGDSRASLPPAQTVTRPPPQANGATANTPTQQSQAAPESSAADQQTNKEELFKRLGELVKAAPVMLFMKGTPSAPQCGFSRQTVSVLREKGVRYGFFNILADDEVRQGLKEFADWPTFPQLWVDGELVGGLDIVSCDST